MGAPGAYLGKLLLVLGKVTIFPMEMAGGDGNTRPMPLELMV